MCYINIFLCAIGFIYFLQKQTEKDGTMVACAFSFSKRERAALHLILKAQKRERLGEPIERARNCVYAMVLWDFVHFSGILYFQ